MVLVIITVHRQQSTFCSLATSPFYRLSCPALFLATEPADFRFCFESVSASAHLPVSRKVMASTSTLSDSFPISRSFLTAANSAFASSTLVLYILSKIDPGSRPISILDLKFPPPIGRVRFLLAGRQEFLPTRDKCARVRRSPSPVLSVRTRGIFAQSHMNDAPLIRGHRFQSNGTTAIHGLLAHSFSQARQSLFAPLAIALNVDYEVGALCRICARPSGATGAAANPGSHLGRRSTGPDRRR